MTSKTKWEIGSTWVMILQTLKKKMKKNSKNKKRKKIKKWTNMVDQLKSCWTRMSFTSNSLKKLSYQGLMYFHLNIRLDLFGT